MTASFPPERLMLIDAHHHLWAPAQRAYPFMAAEPLAPIRRSYDLADLERVTRPLGVEATVLVQAVSTQEETNHLLAIADSSHGLVSGVVGWTDLTSPDVSSQLAAVRGGPGGARLVGVRHQAEDEPDPNWLVRPAVTAGVAAVGNAGLVYDLLVKAPQWAAALALVRRTPGTVFVLDHAGKPDIAGGAWAPWAQMISALSPEPNVHVKLSGLVNQARWSDWTTAELQPYAEHVLDSFGADRVMLGSDWPVSELAGDYARVMLSLRSLLDGLGNDERVQVLGRTAERTYGLRVVPGGPGGERVGRE